MCEFSWKLGPKMTPLRLPASKLWLINVQHELNRKKSPNFIVPITKQSSRSLKQNTLISIWYICTQKLPRHSDIVLHGAFPPAQYLPHPPTASPLLHKSHVKWQRIKKKEAFCDFLRIRKGKTRLWNRNLRWDQGDWIPAERKRVGEHSKQRVWPIISCPGLRHL